MKPRIPINVCYIISSLEVGGAEKQCINVLNTLVADNKFIIVLSSGSVHDLSKMLNTNNVTIFRIPVRLRYFPYHIYKIIFFLISNKINIVHSHMYWSSVYAVLSARLAGIPVIITSEHGMNPWKNSVHYWIEKWILTPLVTIRICVSNDIMDNRINKHNIDPKKLIVIPNGTHVYHAGNQIIKNNKTNLIAIGRLIPAKDYITLIHAIDLLKNKIDNFELSILGDGLLKPSIEKLIAEKSLDKHITLLGNVENINHWLNNSSIFVMSSKREGQPMSLLEAMASGLPIVATNVGGIPDTVEDGKEAILVNASDPQSLADAILKLILDDKLSKQLGHNAYLRVSRDYSIKSVCKRLKDLYIKLLISKTSVL